MFELLDATARTDIALTESYAMLPAAAVSGWYFSHPESRYFGVGKVDEDQLQSYAERKQVTGDEARRLLTPNLVS